MRLLTLAAALLAACAYVPTEMRVMVEPPYYVATMSSTPGLGLTPIAEAPPGMKVRYRWTTDGGFFLTVSETTREIVNLGQNTVTEDGKLFWSYDPGGQGALENRPVAVTVLTENRKNGKEVARTEFALAWDGQYFRAKH